MSTMFIRPTCGLCHFNEVDNVCKFCFLVMHFLLFGQLKLVVIVE